LTTPENETALDDRELALRVRNGECVAFEKLYLRYKQGVYLYCTRFLGHGPAAEDTFQEVFLKCFEQLRQGKDITNIRGYLLSTAHNRCLNCLRDQKHPVRLGDIEDGLAAPVENSDDKQTLQEMLQHIPHENREALLLCEYQGYSYDEIAEIISVPVSTVRKRIFRARRKLRLMLEANNAKT